MPKLSTISLLIKIVVLSKASFANTTICHRYIIIIVWNGAQKIEAHKININLNLDSPTATHEYVSVQTKTIQKPISENMGLLEIWPSFQILYEQNKMIKIYNPGLMLRLTIN